MTDNGRGWRGLRILKASWAVLKQQPTLLVFPVISATAVIAVTAAVGLPIYFRADSNGAQNLAIAFAWYYVCTVTVIFFNAALIACALQHMAGENTSVSAGLAAAGRRLPQILGWALIAASIGALLQILQTVLRDKLGFLGDLIGGIVGTAWSVATYFVVPTLVVEGVGPIKAARRSSALLRRTWGESLTGAGGLGLVQLLLTLPAIGLGFLAFKIQGAAGVTLGAIVAIYALVLIIVFSSLNAIFRAGVYTYGTTGRVPSNLDPALVQNAFRPK